MSTQSLLSILASTPVTPSAKSPSTREPESLPNPTRPQDYSVTLWQGHIPEDPTQRVAVIKRLPDLTLESDKRDTVTIEVQGTKGPEGRTSFQVNQRVNTPLHYVVPSGVQRKWAFLSALEDFLKSGVQVPFGSTFRGSWGDVEWTAEGLILSEGLKREAELILQRASSES